MNTWTRQAATTQSTPIPARPADRAAAGLRILRHAERPLPDGRNFSLILQQVMVVGTIAIGQTLIILTAGIDLSCGMVMALGGIVMTKLAVGELGVPRRSRSLRAGVAALFGWSTACW
jgi:ribose/xylose/arabinose/galactoside ABC-type transport system permease subunit